MSQYMRNFRNIAAVILIAGTILPSGAQVVRKKDRKDNEKTTAGVTFRIKDFYEEPQQSDANLMWEKIIYRQLDLTKDQNLALYYPEEPTENQESLFRIIMKLVTSGQISAYEYLDGREMFTDQYKIKVSEMLDRFHIIYTEAKGSTEKNPKFNIEESDVPSNEVLTYYVIEKWEFNSNENRMKRQVEAICPVLHRSDDFGGEPIRYPMFWTRFSDLRPYLAQQNIFIDDDNNLPKYNYDDFFQLSMYDGEIYKTKNLRNRTLMQMFPDPEELKHAQDSIENRLKAFDKNLWVPTREELEARAEAEEKERLRAEGKSDDIVVKERDGDNSETAVESDDDDEKEAKNRRSVRKKSSKKSDKSSKKKKSKVKESSVGKNSSSNAVRSVRRRR